VTWRYEDVSQPVTIHAITWNPAGAEWVEILPAESFYWLEPNYGFNQPGSYKFGQYLLQPMHPEEAMSRWVVPRIRGNRHGLQILTVQPLPGLPQQLPLPSLQVPLYGVMATVAYTENGQAIEEEIYGVMLVHPPVPGATVQTNWGFIRLFCFRAAKSGLAAVRPLCWNVVQSVQNNPAWEQQVYNPVQQQLHQGFQQYIQAGYDQINAATQMSKMISAQNDAFYQGQQQRRDANWQSHEQRKQEDTYGQYTKEDAFGDMIMGRESYHDPFYKHGTEHYGYSQFVWTNGQGEYQRTDDPNFDPNIGSNQNWTLMQKKNIGDK
jgi:hypothetical protein